MIRDDFMINKFLKNNIIKIIIIFLLSSPILDLMTSLSLNVLNLSFNYIIIFKVLVMFVLIYYLFFISKTKYKKISIIYILLIGIYFLLFSILTIENKPNSYLFYEINNFIRVFYFPINLICIVNIYEENKLNINIKTLSIILFTYIVLIFIPLVTNLGFDSYAYSKEGTIGFFNSTNEIGGILSILLPIGIYYLSSKKIYIIFPLVLIILFTYFSLGTKVPILSMILLITLILIRYIIKLVKEKKLKKILIIFITLLFSFISGIYFIPKTSFYKNLEIHLNYLKVDEVSDIVDTKIIDKFIFSDRISYYTNTKENYNKSSTTEKLLGIGYSENIVNIDLNKTIEMDYFDIFFRYGIIGFLIFFIPYIYILFTIFKKTIKLKKIDNELFTLYISLILILILSLFSGHIIVAPSVSIFVIMILIKLLKKLEVKL